MQRSVALSWLMASLVEAVCCPLHGLGRFVIAALGAVFPALLPQQLNASVSHLVYWLLSGGRPPAVPSLRHFQLLAEANHVVHHLGVALSLALLVAPFVRAWAKLHYAIPNEHPNR